MKKISLTRGKFALVDDEDYEKLVALKWYTYPEKYTFYARTIAKRTGGKRTTVKMHRIIMGAPPNMLVDHIDGDGLNNQRSNLRLVTITQSNRNRRGWSCLGLKGVSRHRNRFQARITVDKVSKSIGYFDTQKEAHEAYLREARKYEHFGNGTQSQTTPVEVDMPLYELDSDRDAQRAICIDGLGSWD